jgi:hydrogenase nickel incorporation protein HypB
MCKDCGCSIVGDVGIDGAHATEPVHPQDHTHHPDHTHDHGHSHPHAHPHEHPNPLGAERRTVPVHQAILEKNDRLAERNRGYFMAKGVLVLNVLSSPGSGKTTFLQRTASDLAGQVRLGVIVGDLETDNDAQRLRKSGVPAVQITTGSVCHLEAEMVARAMERLPLDDLDLLVIENVGNLVCPASYDLGESLRVVLLSVTEGEDKPLKYPVMFKTADVIVVNKIDIAEAVGFDRESALGNIRRIAPDAAILEVSSRTGQGMSRWYTYLEDHRLREKSHAAPHSQGPIPA